MTSCILKQRIKRISKQIKGRLSSSKKVENLISLKEKDLLTMLRNKKKINLLLKIKIRK
jgi:hypothetical protein